MNRELLSQPAPPGLPMASNGAPVRATRPPIHLTPRELDVVRYVLLGEAPDTRNTRWGVSLHVWGPDYEPPPEISVALASGARDLGPHRAGIARAGRARAPRAAARRRGRTPAAGRTRSSAGHRSVLEDHTMTPIDDRELDEVAGANTQREVIDFVERVLRDLQRIWEQPVDPNGL
jgi:hypothetical protein